MTHGLLQKLVLSMSICLLINSISATDAKVEEVVEAPRLPHNYLTEAYNVTAYDGIIDRKELFKIYITNTASTDIYRETVYSCFPEEDWKTTNDILQIFYIRNMRVPYILRESPIDEVIDSIFTYPKSVVKSIKKGGWQDHPNRIDALFYFWKQAAWVNADVADKLARALREGYEDLIPINPEWAEYWDRRAAILRAQPQWYKPIKRIIKGR